VTFSGSVRVKTIEPRKSKSKAISKINHKLSLLFSSRNDDDDDDDDDEVDWDMEKFADDADGPSKVWGGDAMEDDEDDEESDEDEDGDDDDEDGAEDNEGDSEDEDGSSFHGVETIQRLKDDLFDDNEDEGVDAGLEILFPE
jgi:hypothetical protein